MEDIIEQLISAFNDFAEDKDEFGIYVDMQQKGIKVTKEAEISGELHKLAFRSCIIGIIQNLTNCDNDTIASLVKKNDVRKIMRLIEDNYWPTEKDSNTDEVKHCGNCTYCEYDEAYDRETGEETRMWECLKNKAEDIYWDTIACDEYEEN